MIIKITISPKKNKKFRAIMDDGVFYDFGLKGSETYLDHYNDIKRDNYKNRHLSNPKEHYNIKNIIMSPALLSYYLLWGPYTNLKQNTIYLNELLKHQL